MTQKTLYFPQTTKLDLPMITLVCADSNHVNSALNSLRICQAFCKFGRTILFTHEDVATDANDDIEIKLIPKLESREDYCKFALRKMPWHIKTSHYLIVQWDGYIVNPDAWDNNFLAWDYIAPPFTHKHHKPYAVGGSGFNLRTKRGGEQMSYIQCGQNCFPDDVNICIRHREEMDNGGVTFAPVELALKFAVQMEKYDDYNSFGFHHYDYNDPLGIKEQQANNELIQIVKFKDNGTDLELIDAEDLYTSDLASNQFSDVEACTLQDK